MHHFVRSTELAGPADGLQNSISSLSEMFMKPASS